MAERGLKVISFRLEQERFNVWVSLINLEHKFGTRATLKAVMERACQNTKPKKVYLHVAEVGQSRSKSKHMTPPFRSTDGRRHTRRCKSDGQLCSYWFRPLYPDGCGGARLSDHQPEESTPPRSRGPSNLKDIIASRFRNRVMQKYTGNCQLF